MLKFSEQYTGEIRERRERKMNYSELAVVTSDELITVERLLHFFE